MCSVPVKVLALLCEEESYHMFVKGSGVLLVVAVRGAQLGT